MFVTWLNNAALKRNVYRLRKADIYIEKGDFSKAIDILQRIDVNDELKDLVFSKISNCYRSQGNPSGAIRYFSEFLKRGELSESVYLGLADSYETANDIWNQFFYLLEAFKINSNSDAVRSLSRLCGTKMDFNEVYRIISEHFDPEYYLRTYADIKEANVTPLAHYVMWGWKEGRRPNASFDPERFVKLYGHSLHSQDIPLVAFHQQRDRFSKFATDRSGSPWHKLTPHSDIEWQSVPGAADVPDAECTVIIPVYKGLDETLNAIWQALQARNGEKYNVLVINDCSPDGLLSDKLLQLSELGMFRYILNDTNKGFVKTINYAISQCDQSCDVILLNSDAYVFEGWYSRLANHAKSDLNIATITPLSNNATICSYPRINFPNVNEIEIDPRELDLFAAKFNKGISVDAPTGVGFCFYMRRSIIDKIGALDAEAFEVGYGEECDYCMRALNHGYRNVIAADVFVYHIGSVSFSQIKEKHFNRGQETIQKRHVNYKMLVEAHVLSDPLAVARSNLDLARIALAFHGARIIVSHDQGGGIEKYVRDERQNIEESGEKCLVIKVFGGDRLTFDMSNENLSLFNVDSIDIINRIDDLRRFIVEVEPSGIIINSLYGLNWRAQTDIIQLITDELKNIIYVCHDYSIISHNYQLTRPDMLFININEFVLGSDVLKTGSDGALDAVPLAERHSVYENLLRVASHVIAPSNAAASIIKNFYPNIKIEVIPHVDPVLSIAKSKPIAPKNRNQRLQIACIGAIGPHKGSFVLQNLAMHIKENDVPIDLHIIGYSDRDPILKSLGVSISGRYYNDEEALSILVDINPHFVFIPSIWPETFCYALSFGIGLNMPVAVFDLGAQAERARQVKDSLIIPSNFINYPSGLANQFIGGARMVFDLPAPLS